MPGAGTAMVDDSCMAAHGVAERKSITVMQTEPVVQHAALQCFLKGEDVVLCQPCLDFPATKRGGLTNGGWKAAARCGSYGLYCVFDGHNGVACAQHIHDLLLEALHTRLPSGVPPLEREEAAAREWREGLQWALVSAIDEVQHSFACEGRLAGATATIVLQAGWLVTVASIGDSRAALDTGAGVVQLSVDHRVATHKAERRRLDALGIQIAPIDTSGVGPADGPSATGWGPLRVWPGGLCLSRSLGDFDVGACVLALPHIFQVRVPNTGGRLVVASDGVWDAFAKPERVARMSRGWHTEEAPERLVEAIRRAHGGLKDDTSVIVLDLLPPGCSWPAIAGKKTPSRRSTGCLCFSPATLDASPPPLGQAQVLADLDVAAAVGLMGAPVADVPSWCTSTTAEALRRSQGAAVEAWKGATSMRKMGREPSRVDLEGFFAGADADAAAAANITKAEALPAQGTMPPEAPKIKKTARFAPGALEDYTVKAGVCAPPSVPDYSVRAGGNAARRGAQGRGAGGTLGGVLGSGDGAHVDRSVRFRRNIASPEDFASQFGAYKGRLEDCNDASGSGRGPELQSKNSGNKQGLWHADPSVRFRDAVAPAEGGGFAAKFGAYSDDPRSLIPGDSGHGPGDHGDRSDSLERADGKAAKGKLRGGLFGRRTPGARLSMDAVGAPERSPEERGIDAGTAEAPPSWTSANKRKKLPFGIIHPKDTWYRNWLYTTLVGALWTSVYVPYILAFQDHPGLYPYDSFKALLEYATVALFAVDIVFKFRLAFYDEELLVDDARAIAMRYLRGWFTVDFLSTFPFALMRMYRLGWLFEQMEINLSINLLWTTLFRNVLVTWLATHWAGCILYYIALQEGLSEHTWLQIKPDFVASLSSFGRYILSVYWSITTLSTVGYGDWNPTTPLEMGFVVFYMLFNVFLNAYVLGTITILIVKHDQKLGTYRERIDNCRQYSAINDVPPDLTASMMAHLRLSFNNEQASDERVLSSYPTTIRRRVLRHLYLQRARSCRLFEGVQTKCMDSLLNASKVELFMPKIEVIAEGDYSNELYIIVHGEELGAGAAGENSDVRLQVDQHTSVHGGQRTLGEGDTFGEFAFFTGVRQASSVQTLTVCRVLTITHAAYAGVAGAFPLSARRVLLNLHSRAQEVVDLRFRGDRARSLLDRAPPELKYAFAHPETAENAMQAAAGDLSPTQQQCLAQLMRLRHLVSATIAKQDEDRTQRFLFAASRGDGATVRSMLEQGFSADSADYDGRSALMLSAGKGHTDVVEMLLGAGADANLRDCLGGSALLGAAQAGHHATIDVLTAQGATLGLLGAEAAGRMCSCVHSGDLVLLRNLMRAGIDINAADYDMRTALMVAAADGSLAAVKLLVEEGNAPLNSTDRWGHTALDEATREQRCDVIVYLRQRNAPTTGRRK
ncbi:hypothetical protein WJX81_004819 [Elliptochloris bilobata]|uniref:Uncharacterized protein n=1 Tax=Elliptochloris bilobata TaxID=381761 RepID=A0AAW1S4V0_9CHLO